LEKSPSLMRRGDAGLPPGSRLSPEAIRIVDSTLWKVVPRMKWAQWRTQGTDQNAVRLHVRLRLADLQVEGADLTEARVCERAPWLANARAGEFYIGDRYYGGDYGVLERLEQKGCGFLVRLRHTAVLEVRETRETDPEASARGVEYDVTARLGHGKAGYHGPWRVVRFQKPGMDEPVILVASGECGDLSATEIMELYRRRWQVEMFFRWLKCLVPCRHWFAESQNGVRVQIYLCLIQALLLAEMTGARPSRRMMELLRWHQLGWATDAELVAGLARFSRERDAVKARLAAKKAAAPKKV
ncbi:MAG: IS4 family transposase, partial [Verrucomicrobiaceae bacterium]